MCTTHHNKQRKVCTINTINKCWNYSKEGDTTPCWNYEKLHKEGSGDRDGLESTDNRAFWKDEKLGGGKNCGQGTA